MLDGATNYLYGAEVPILNDINYIAKMDIKVSYRDPITKKLKDLILNSGSYFKLEDTPEHLKAQIKSLIISRHLKPLEVVEEVVVEDVTVLQQEITKVESTTVTDLVQDLLERKRDTSVSSEVVPDIIDSMISRSSKSIELIRVQFEGLEHIKDSDIEIANKIARQNKLRRLKQKRA